MIIIIIVIASSDDLGLLVRLLGLGLLHLFLAVGVVLGVGRGLLLELGDHVGDETLDLAEDVLV